MKNLALILILGIAFLNSATAQLSSEPDTYETEKGDLTVYPLNHGTLALTFNDLTIFVDPFGGADLFADFDAPDLIFITDIHGDHLNPETLNGLDTENTTFVVPQAVAEQMDQKYNDQLMIMDNDDESLIEDLMVRAIPMYNLPEENDSFHTKGRGNGYVITLAGKNIYISGDTEDIPEMRALEGIDIAFVCMNLPYTMTAEQAADAVVDFEPTIVYPYHYRGQNIEEFKKLVEAGEVDTKVVLKDWYSN